jgi:hypothetical protein
MLEQRQHVAPIQHHRAFLEGARVSSHDPIRHHELDPVVEELRKGRPVGVFDWDRLCHAIETHVAEFVGDAG